MEQLRKQFPVFRQGIYVDTAASGLLYEDLLEWRQGHDLDFLIGGSRMKFESFAMIHELRPALADFFNAWAEEVALVPNFSIGLNFILEALPKDVHVLLLDADYPSVNWPFESRGFPCTYIRADERMEDRIWKALASEKVTIFAFSLVQWLDGIRLDLDFIREIKAKYPDILLIADGTQFCGALDLDFSSSGIDILGASGYKWLLGGYGNGFFLFQPGVKNKMSLPLIGFNATDGRPENKMAIPFARRLEPGHLDSFNFLSMKFSLEWLSRIGMPRISAHNEELGRKAKAAFADLGLLDEKVVCRQTHGPIFSLTPSAGLGKALREAGVMFSERGGRLRLSFHLYNTLDDLNLVIDVIKGQV